MDIWLEIIGVIFFAVFTIFDGVFSFCKAYQIIYEEKFRKVKIKRFKFLFRNLYGEKIGKDGLIFPVFVFELISYIIALVELVFGIVNLLLGISPRLPLVCTLLAFMVGTVLFQLILSVISKKKAYPNQKKRKQPK